MKASQDNLRTGVAAVFLALAAVLTAVAGPVLNDPETWDNVPSLEGWTNALPYGTEDSALSNPSGYLRITFAQQPGAPQMETDTIFTQGSNYTGNFTIPSLGLTFGFYSEDVTPLSSMVYLHSAVSDSVWEYVFSAALGWTTLAIPFEYGAGWSGPGGAAAFLADLANVDRIGVTIGRDFPNTSQQDYGLDNWEYYIIPEPGTAFALSSVLISLAITFRRRLASKG